MIIKFEKNKENPVNLFRRAGYVFQRKEADEMSFIRVFSQSGYPRFHIYCHLEEADLIVNLHLDQKRETYGDSTRHQGEYENNPIIEQEATRLKSIMG